MITFGFVLIVVGFLLHIHILAALGLFLLIIGRILALPGAVCGAVLGRLPYGGAPERRAVALSSGLDFVPLTWEHFDLALRQRGFFLPGPQALAGFLRTAAFRERAAELRGYDVTATGTVRHVN